MAVCLRLWWRGGRRVAGRKGGLLRYAILLVVVGYVTVVGAFIYSAKDIWIAGCRPAPDPDQFISLCGSSGFGDYEHDAFWFGLEPAAIVNLKAADVVFTGSSRTMFAFSTAEVRSYFAARGLRQFNLGFSGEDGQIFFTKLAAKYDLHPRVLVIGVDPYFTDRVSVPAAAAIDTPVEIGRGLMKWAQIRLQPELCRRKILDCDKVGHTAFRSSTDGYFLWRDILMPDGERHRAHQTRPRDFQVDVPEAAKAAETLFSRIGIPAACVVMVPMPLPEIWPKPDPVKRVADAVGAAYIDVDTGDDLTFLDEMHLSYWSAKRFSAAFVRAFDQLPQTCLGGSPPLIAAHQSPPAAAQYTLRDPRAARNVP